MVRGATGGKKGIEKSQQHPRASRAVPHPSTDRAFGGLSSEFEWDREFSTEYGRWREGLFAEGPRGRILRPRNGSILHSYGKECNIIPSESYYV